MAKLGVPLDLPGRFHYSVRGKALFEHLVFGVIGRLNRLQSPALIGIWRTLLSEGAGDEQK